MAETAESRQRQNRAAELQRMILSADSDIRRAREKLNALKRAHAPSTTSAETKRLKTARLPTEVCEALMQLRDTLRISMRDVAALKKDKSRLEGIVQKSLGDEAKCIARTEKAKTEHVPGASFLKYDAGVVAAQRVEHAKSELAAVHTVIDSQMKHLTRAFDTAARKCELDKQLMFLQQEAQKKKAALELIEDECASMGRVYNRKKLCVSRQPKPLDPMAVLHLDKQKEVVHDTLTKQENAAVAVKESIAYRANLLCQLERTLKVTSDAVQHHLDGLQQQQQQQQQQHEDVSAAAAPADATPAASDASPAAAAAGDSREGSAQQQQNAPVRATTLTSLRTKIAALNTRDAQLDDALTGVDKAVSDLEYRAKVMNQATGSLEKERTRLLKQHGKHVKTLRVKMDENTAIARALIDDQRSRSESLAQ